MIKYTDPFGNDAELVILPVKFFKHVHIAIDSKYRFIAKWDLRVAKEAVKYLQEAIHELEKNENDTQSSNEN